MPDSNPACVVNPQLDLSAVRREGTVASITVRAPVRGAGLRVTTIERSEPGTFGALLLHMISGEAPVNPTAAEYERLCEIGFLVPPERVSHPVWFSCDVLDPPLELVPRRAERSIDREQALNDLVVNPTLRHFGSDGPPASMRGRLKLRNRFRTDRSWFWLQGTDLCAPGLYSYSPEAGHGLDRLVAGEPAPATLDDRTRHRLMAADVIQPAAPSPRRRDGATTAAPPPAASCTISDTPFFGTSFILCRWLPPAGITGRRLPKGS